MLVGAFFENEVYSHTFLSCLFVHGCFTAVTVFGGFVLPVRAFFRTRYIHTPFLSSRPAPTWRLVSDRHDPSTFSGVDMH